MLGFLVFLIVGGLAGWLAAKIVEGKGLGVVGNVLVGWLGAGLANFLFGSNIALSEPTLMSFILAVVGAVILLFIVNFVFSRFRRNKD
jgi:uncharacterized membrane protein YeaQ/YmgE (transglycosylase-associated protein family)